MSYKYHNGSTPEEVNSEDSDPGARSHVGVTLLPDKSSDVKSKLTAAENYVKGGRNGDGTGEFGDAEFAKSDSMYKDYSVAKKQNNQNAMDRAIISGALSSARQKPDATSVNPKK